MNVVHKYSLVQCDLQSVMLPIGAEILSVQEQHGCWQLWALVDSQLPPVERRKIRIAGTGHPICEPLKRFINTFQMCNGALVFHAFEVKE